MISSTTVDLRLVIHREFEASHLVWYHVSAVETRSPDQFRETYLMLMSVGYYNYLAGLH